MSSEGTATRVTLVGAGSIGISFAALYLKHSPAIVSIYDPRPDLEAHLKSVLPVYLDTDNSNLSLPSLLDESKRLRICSSLKEACLDADIVQEQGPENLPFKSALWSDVAGLVSDDTHLWSSTSGIPASQQAAKLSESVKRRLLIAHPFNPPHLMPLIEVVPSPTTHESRIGFVCGFFIGLGSGHQPVVVKKEVPGFVGNRLAFALLREACHLVAEGVVSAEDLDTIVEASVGPRWAVTGPLKSYHYGGGVKGLGAFLDNLGGTIDDIWADLGQDSIMAPASDAESGISARSKKIVAEVENAYGMPTPADFRKRDAALKNVLHTKSL